MTNFIKQQQQKIERELINDSISRANMYNTAWSKACEQRNQSAMQFYYQMKLKADAAVEALTQLITLPTNLYA